MCFYLYIVTLKTISQNSINVRRNCSSVAIYFWCEIPKIWIITLYIYIGDISLWREYSVFIWPIYQKSCLHSILTKNWINPKWKFLKNWKIFSVATRLKKSGIIPKRFAWKDITFLIVAEEPRQKLICYSCNGKWNNVE